MQDERGPANAPIRRRALLLALVALLVVVALASQGPATEATGRSLALPAELLAAAGLVLLALAAAASSALLLLTLPERGKPEEAAPRPARPPRARPVGALEVALIALPILAVAGLMVGVLLAPAGAGGPTPVPLGGAAGTPLPPVQPALAAPPAAPAPAIGAAPHTSPLLTTLFVIVGIWMAVGALTLGIWWRRARSDQPAGRQGRGRVSVLGIVIGMLLSALAIALSPQHQPAPATLPPGPRPTPLPPPAAPPAAGPAHRAGGLPLPALLALLLACLVLAGLLLARRRRPVLGPTETAADEVAAALALGVDELTAEPDPRRAVIAAYAAMEATLERGGLPRRPHEAPFEFVRRALTAARLDGAAAHRLTALSERAGYSPHLTTPEMKAEAVRALRAIQDELARRPERAGVA